MSHKDRVHSTLRRMASKERSVKAAFFAHLIDRCASTETTPVTAEAQPRSSGPGCSRSSLCSLFSSLRPCRSPWRFFSRSWCSLSTCSAEKGGGAA